MGQLVKNETFNSAMSIGRAEIKRNGLIIEEGLSSEEWTNEVIAPLRSMIQTMNGSMLWWWGDALAYGEKCFGYKDALEGSDYLWYAA